MAPRLRVRPAAAIAWVTCVICIGGGCARSHGRGSGADVVAGDPGPSDEGEASGGRPPTPGVVDAGLDGGGPSLPLRDAELPEPTEDAGIAPDAQVDAGAPPDTRPDLLFSRQPPGRTTSSLHVMRGADLSVQALGPPPARRPMALRPLMYSPDGRLLLVSGQTGTQLRAWLVPVCRPPACTSPAFEPVQIVEAQTPDHLLQADFASDGSGVVGVAGQRVVYVPIDAGRPRAPVTLLEVPPSRGVWVDLVGQGRALLVADGFRVQLFDLQAVAAGDVQGIVLDASQGYVAQVSPDGAKFVTKVYSRAGATAFSVDAILAGDTQGRSEPVGEREWPAATDGWVVMNRAGGGVTLAPWDPQAPQVTLADTGTLRTCGNRGVWLSETEAAFVDLASSNVSAPTLREVAGVPTAQARFEHGCDKVYFADAETGAALLVDYADPASTVDLSGLVTEALPWKGANPSGSLGMFGGTEPPDFSDEMQRVVALDAPDVVFEPRVPMPRPRFLTHDAALLIAAALVEPMARGLFEVALSQASGVEVTQLSPEGVEVDGFVLSPDERHVAYGVPWPTLPASPADIAAGIFEVDRETRAVRKLLAAPLDVLGGTQWWRSIPGRRAALVVGDYEGAARQSIYVADVDDLALIPQLPDEPVPRALGAAPSQEIHLSPDGALLWYLAYADAPTRYLQPLRFSLDEPLAVAGQLPFDVGWEDVRTGVEHTLGFAGQLGPVYFPFGEAFVHQDLIDRIDLSVVYHFDPVSLEPRALTGLDQTGEIVDARILGPGWVTVSRANEGTRVLSLFRPASPPEQVLALEAVAFSASELSADAHWFGTLARGSDGTDGTRLHLYDTRERVLHAVPSADLGGSAPAHWSFGPHGDHVYVTTADRRRFEVDLSGASVGRAREVAEDAVPSATPERWTFERVEGGVMVKPPSDADAQPRLVPVAAGSPVTLSPRGTWLLVQDRGTGLPSLFRVDQPGEDFVPLAGASGAGDYRFGPAERFVVESPLNEGSRLSVWSLDAPDAPVYLSEPGERVQVSWFEQSP